MKDLYVYEAEYVSEINGEHFLNIDLGFRTWSVRAVTLDTEKKYKPGEKLLIEVHIIKDTRHKKHNYYCIVLK